MPKVTTTYNEQEVLNMCADYLNCNPKSLSLIAYKTTEGKKYIELQQEEVNENSKV